MMDLSQNRECLALEREIADCAEEVEARQIKCGKSKSLIYNNPYPYDDMVERSLLSDLSNFILSHPKVEDQEQITGRFLWKTIKYLGHPFRKHMAKIVDMITILGYVSDVDKIKYMEYMLKAKKFDIYDKKTWFKMANFDLSKNKEGARRLYFKAYAYLNSKKKSYDADVKLMYGMLTSFVNGNQNFTPDQIVYLSRFYFKLSDKTRESLDVKLLAKALFKEEGGSKTSTFKKVALAYASHLAASREVNHPLYEQMNRLVFAVVATENYGLSSVDELKLVFDGGKGRKKNFAEGLKKTIDEGFLRRLQTMPSRANILAKAKRVFKPKQEQRASDIFKNADSLYKNIKDNARLQGLHIEHPTLFDPQAYEIETVDKNLVKDIADIYVHSCHEKTPDESTQQAVSEMFTRIVRQNDYTEKEVEELKMRFASDEDEHPLFVSLRRDIQRAYDAEQTCREDHHYNHSAKRILSPSVSKSR